MIVFHDPHEEFDPAYFRRVRGFKVGSEEPIEWRPDERFIGRPPLVMLDGGACET